MIPPNNLTDEVFSIRFSPSASTPAQRLQHMFLAGQRIGTEHQAKTRAGMLRKTHPQWAKSLLDGFYSRPDAPPRPSAPQEGSKPAPGPPKDTLAEARLALDEVIAEFNVVIQHLEKEYATLNARDRWRPLARLKLRISRISIFGYARLFTKLLSPVAGASQQRRGCDIGFRCALWRNLLKSVTLAREFFDMAECISRPEPRYLEMLAKHSSIADKWATKDAQGNVLLMPDTIVAGRQCRQFTPENQAAAEAELSVLMLAYADAIARYDEQLAQVKAYCDKTIEVEICGVPFAWVADYVEIDEAIMCMVTDPPYPDWPPPTSDTAPVE